MIHETHGTHEKNRSQSIGGRRSEPNNDTTVPADERSKPNQKATGTPSSSASAPSVPGPNPPAEGPKGVPSGKAFHGGKSGIGMVDPRGIDRLTRDELYDRAKTLNIAGRSKMTKAQLSSAVAEVMAVT